MGILKRESQPQGKAAGFLSVDSVFYKVLRSARPMETLSYEFFRLRIRILRLLTVAPAFLPVAPVRLFLIRVHKVVIYAAPDLTDGRVTLSLKEAR
jgi:hypothetical protein